MINAITSYMTNPIYDKASKSSRYAFFCIQPAHQLSHLMNRVNTASFQIDSSPKSTDRSIRHCTSPHFRYPYARPGVDKIIKQIALTILYSIAAIPLTPLALIFHRYALHKTPSLKKASDELEIFKKDRALYFALKGDRVSLEDEIRKSNSLNFERFITKTSQDWSLLSLAQEKSWNEIITILIKKCPENHLETLNEPNKDGLTLLRWAINEGHDTIIEACAIKGLTVPLVLDSLGRGIVDAAIQKKRFDFAFNFMCSTADDQLHLLFGNQANFRLLPDQFRETFLDKLEGVYNNDPEKLKSMLLHKCEDGKTLMHRQHFLGPLFGFLKALGIEQAKILNDDGLSPVEQWFGALSEEWIIKPKYQDRDVENIPVQKYRERANNLQRDVLEIWDSLSFGTAEGEVNPNVLFVGKGQNFTKNQIKDHLKIMLQKIVSEEVWLGTPSRADPSRVHLFYCQMLTNFEKVVNELKKTKSPQKSANFLVDIAKTSIEGRCASAYQEEIDQKALLCIDENTEMTYEKIFEKAVCAALQSIITKIVTEEENSNVHVWRQMNYTCGLSKIPDGMGDECINFRYVKRVRDAFEITSFLQRVGNDIPLEAAADYLKETIEQLKPIGKVEHLFNWVKELLPVVVQQIMPESIKKRYREARDFAVKKEETLINQANKQLKSLAKDKKSCQALFEAIQNVRSVDLPEIDSRETLVKKIIRKESEKLQTLTNCPDLNFLSLYKKAKGDYNVLKTEIIAVLKAKNLYKGRIPLQIGQFLAHLEKRIGAAKKFQEVVIPLLKKKEFFSRILQVQKKYQTGLEKLVEELKSFNEGEEEELDLDFDHNSYLLPSQAIDHNYRIYEAQPDLGHKNRMLLKILKKQKIILMP